MLQITNTRSLIPYLLPSITQDESGRKCIKKLCLGDCTYNMLISVQSSRD